MPNDPTDTAVSEESKIALKPLKARCSKCSAEFDCKPGELNSTGYLGKTSLLYGAGGFLPECPKCGNWRDNRLLDSNGVPTKPLRF